MKKQVLAVLVENKPGVLARVAGLFSRRGYNIESLAVGETIDPTVSRMTIAVTGDEAILEQISKQLNKLIDVIKVIDLTSTAYVDREMILVKVAVTSGNRPEVMQIIDIFRGRIVDVAEHSLTVEITGTEEKNQAALDLLRKFGIKEVVRTGKVAISRGS